MESERSRSLVHDFESEWRKRPVNVMKVFKSLVNQLTVGADLTRITMPSEICHPFSVLEVVGYREISYFGALFAINDHPDNSLERFLCVVRWFISCLPQEQMEKKPFNPTIGEHNIGWIEHSKDDWTELIAEQVSHHPPLTAIFLRNEKRKISVEATLDFTVSFGGANHVVITSGGHAIIKTEKEDYIMSKLVPNLVIQRIIFGVKYYMWDGDLVIECPKHGYKLNISFSEKNETTNKIKGHISQNGTIVYNIRGAAGAIVYYWKPDDKKKKKQELYNFSTFPKTSEDSILYPSSESRLAMNSLRVWKPVADAVIKDDMFTADNAKRKIEAEQRIREKKRELEGAAYQAVFFNQKTIDDKVYWEPKEGIKISQEYFDSLKEVVALQRAKELEEEQQQQNQSVSQGTPTKTENITSPKSKSSLESREGSLKGSRDKLDHKSPEKKKHSKGTQFKDGGESPHETKGSENSGQPTGQDDENCTIS